MTARRSRRPGGREIASSLSLRQLGLRTGQLGWRRGRLSARSAIGSVIACANRSAPAGTNTKCSTRPPVGSRAWDVASAGGVRRRPARNRGLWSRRGFWPSRGLWSSHKFWACRGLWFTKGPRPGSPSPCGPPRSSRPRGQGSAAHAPSRPVPASREDKLDLGAGVHPSSRAGSSLSLRVERGRHEPLSSGRRQSRSWPRHTEEAPLAPVREHPGRPAPPGRGREVPSAGSLLRPAMATTRRGHTTAGTSPSRPRSSACRLQLFSSLSSFFHFLAPRPREFGRLAALIPARIGRCHRSTRLSRSIGARDTARPWSGLLGPVARPLLRPGRQHSDPTPPPRRPAAWPGTSPGRPAGPGSSPTHQRGPERRRR